MTQEEKQLLLIDLCARLPYGVKILDIPANVVGCLFLVSKTDTVQYESAEDEINNDTGCQTLYNIKPYLRPISSITEAERCEFEEMFDFPFAAGYNTVTKETIVYDYIVIDKGYDVEIGIDDIALMLDWLISRHFDCHNLIQKGLALEAPDGMYENF